MSGLIIVEKPKFRLVPDIFVDRFEEEVFYAYETLARNNLNKYGDVECLPKLEQFDDDSDMKELLLNITSLDMFEDEDYEGFLNSEETAEVFFDRAAENICNYVHDTWLVLDHYKMSLATSGEIFNSPIREVW